MELASRGRSPGFAAKRVLSSGEPGGRHHTAGSAAKRAREMMTGAQLSGGTVGQDDLFDGLNRREVVWLLLQGLTDMGYGATCAALERESGVGREPQGVADLRQAVSCTCWDDAVSAVGRLEVEEVAQNELRFLLLEQKYLEGVAQEAQDSAQRCILEELASVAFDADSRLRVHELQSVSTSSQSLERGWSVEGSREVLWGRIQALLQPRLAMPPRRLSVLLWQARRYQELHCLYHHVDGHDPSSCSLLRDHTCRPPPLPTRCVARLDRHMDEVWFVAVSHSGKYIASSSKDKTVILWDCTPPATFGIACVLIGHSEPCSCVSWSRDDRYVLTASNDRTVRLWEPPSDCSVRLFAKHTEPVTSVGWLHDSRHFISAGFDRWIYLWNVDGTELHRWEVPSRVQDVAVTHDGKHMLVVNSDRNLKVINLLTRRELFTLPESDAVTSVCASQLRDEVLVNISQQVNTAQQAPVIRLWDLGARRVVQRYLGHFQGRFVVRSGFGGPREQFVISGSEDGQVYIWHRHYGSLLEVLPGHASTVNSVVWPCVFPGYSGSCCPWLVSAADDHTLRIWGPDSGGDDEPAPQTNGASHNGTSGPESAQAPEAPGDAVIEGGGSREDPTVVDDIGVAVAEHLDGEGQQLLAARALDDPLPPRLRTSSGLVDAEGDEEEDGEYASDVPGADDGATDAAGRVRVSAGDASGTPEAIMTVTSDAAPAGLLPELPPH